ncbi:hypothetical protein PHJA_002854900 [Phtheirospermum japonicum]|uniref:Knl1 C-terminal RWD domain-containing protein n=1 Tax=Phtheirospermum japonicum TaxID=374723 RepID=A0A830D3F6_9LAMI|nr:hypothetical protein PHJA_002854900 [Phtheirospermum japonicum]
MDPKENPSAEVHRHITATENSDTMALQRKRARRVSFAETTSIRLFNRDEESDETPLIETARIRDDSPGDFGFGRHPESNMEFGGLDGGNDNDEDEEMDMRRTFLRPIGSPSPGGSTFGSASSNDEDNFFGPVSSNFIKPGRLSDSAASDDHHDVTMDSTAFSMHYRSLARSESGLDLKTPTAGQLFFEEKTPMNANIGSSMTFTLGTKPIPISSTPDAEVSGNHNSNDMSLVGENPNKYDFEKLSPRLDALLAESRKDLLHVSVSDDIIASPSPKPKEAEILPSVDRGDKLINSIDYLREETAWIDSLDVLNEGESAAHVEVGEANGHHGTSPCASSPKKYSPNLLGAAASKEENDIPIKSPLSKVEQLELASPLPQPASMLRNGYAEHQETETSIQKSISKLELLERSAFSSAFSTKADSSLVKTLDFFRSPHHDSLLGKNRHISRINFLEDSITEEKLTSVHQSEERSYISCIDRAMSDTLNHISGEFILDEHLGQIVAGKSPNELRAKSISRDQKKSGGTISSPSKITWSGSKLMRNLFTSKPSDEDALMTETESLLAEISSGDLTPKFVSSPDRRLGKKLSGSSGSQSTPKYRFEDNLPGRDPRAGSDGFVSPSACRDLDEPSFQKNMVESPTSPSRKELDNERSSEIPSPKTTQLSGGLERFSASKRNVELLLRDTQHRNEMILTQRSPKHQKGGNCDSETTLHPIEGETTLIVQERNQWTDTYSKFSEDMKNLVSGLADRLSSKTICALEDVLVHQQRSKVYEMLHIGVMPQNSTADHDFQQKLAETKSLLHRVVFEKAKLQLKHVKKERLLKRLQLLSSRIEESQKLGEDIASLPSQTCTINVIVDAVCDRTLSVNLKKGHEAGHEKLIAMRQTLDTLDRKVLNLTRTFHTCCKIKSELSSAETIALVNKHLAKRTSCRLIRLEMQMWVVHSLDSANGQHNVILNYLDFIIQSIKIIVGPTPNVSSSFKLNEANILKNFPNMDVCIAFAFVFNAETAHRYIGAKTLPQETQVTSSLLGTLLDVVEEVQLAQMEFHNLTQSSFYSPSVERLDLVLCFFNFTSGRKVNFTLDMSCLKRGIYPSEVVPLQSASPGDSESSLSSEPIFDEIKVAVKGVKMGYLRILRLCKRVSQVVRASTA